MRSKAILSDYNRYVAKHGFRVTAPIGEPGKYRDNDAPGPGKNLGPGSLLGLYARLEAVLLVDVATMSYAFPQNITVGPAKDVLK